MKIPFKKSKRWFVISLLYFIAAFFSLCLVYLFFEQRNNKTIQFSTVFWAIVFIYNLVMGFIFLNINKHTHIYITDESISVKYILNRKKEVKFKDIKQVKLIKDKFLVFLREDKKDLKINLDLIGDKNTERLKSILKSRTSIFN